MKLRIPSLILTLALAFPLLAFGQTVETVRPLLSYARTDVEGMLPQGTRLLTGASEIEKWLRDLDGQPPDWRTLYGSGDEGYMDRLFDLNRERDRMRTGNAALNRTVAFVWEGVVSGYDLRTGGLRLAIGPKVIPTRWGQVRFKPYGLPSGLMAVPSPPLRRHLLARKAEGESIDVDLLITGRLVPDESIIYDFAHEEAGQGMVMPVVQVERIDYFLAR